MSVKISVSDNRVNSVRSQQPQFKGLGEAALNIATSAIQQCEANPMLNVAVLDLATAIVPRTVIESKTNPYAGFEAFRRESSGLIINCMIPGVIVAGIANAIQGPIMGGKTKMADCWANGDTIKLVTDYYNKASAMPKSPKELLQFGFDKQKLKVYHTIKGIIQNTQGVDGSDVVKFNSSKFNFDKSVKTLTDSVFTEISKNDIDGAYKAIIKQTHVAENIKIKGQAVEGFFTQGVGPVVKNAPQILKEMLTGGKTSEEMVNAFAKKAGNLVTAKSLLGLGVIIPLALSAQPINRWITQKTSGKKGAPIYKDFEETQARELTAKEKFELNKQKLISASSMIGVALLSIMKKPDVKMFKEITQFKGIFPSMNQARIISTATFVSRMMSAEDKNDLREATVRDIATFSAFYFLGDYVSKGIATIMQNSKKFKDQGIKLINDLAPGEYKGIGQKIWHWTKNTALKSSDEIVSDYGKKMRAACQLGNIGFSLLALGIFIPLLNRHQTNKKREAELKKLNESK